MTGFVMLVAAVPSADSGTTDAKGVNRPQLFDTWTGYQVGQFLEGVVAADLNGDGAADLAWARQSSPGNEMVVQINRSDGSFGAAVGYPASGRSRDIAAGDLDGDQDTDLVVASY